MVKKVQILKTPGCSSCAQATVLIKKIKEEEKLKFSIEELDIIQHPELLQKYQIMTSPGIVIDSKLEFTGTPSEKKLREKLKDN
jgi:glutaredoxin